MNEERGNESEVLNEFASRFIILYNDCKFSELTEHVMNVLGIAEDKEIRNRRFTAVESILSAQHLSGACYNSLESVYELMHDLLYAASVA